MSTNLEGIYEESFIDTVKKLKKTDEFEVEIVRDLISEQIHKAMVVHTITKADLARRLNKSRPYVTKLLQGNGNFTVETLVGISTALGYKFRPSMIPVAQDWKTVVQYCELANVKPNEPINRTINLSDTYNKTNASAEVRRTPVIERKVDDEHTIAN
jgi:transcriptional regulator with XRE-family HTH domain